MVCDFAFCTLFASLNRCRLPALEQAASALAASSRASRFGAADIPGRRMANEPEIAKPPPWFWKPCFFFSEIQGPAEGRGFQTGGFPDVGSSVPICPFFREFPDVTGGFPNLTFPLSLPIKGAYQEQFHRSWTLSGHFPTRTRTGDHLFWETCPFTLKFSQYIAPFPLRPVLGSLGAGGRGVKSYIKRPTMTQKCLGNVVEKGTSFPRIPDCTRNSLKEPFSPGDVKGATRPQNNKKCFPESCLPCALVRECNCNDLDLDYIPKLGDPTWKRRKLSSYIIIKARQKIWRVLLVPLAINMHLWGIMALSNANA